LQSKKREQTTKTSRKCLTRKEHIWIESSTVRKPFDGQYIFMLLHVTYNVYSSVIGLAYKMSDREKGQWTSGV
jgi:hypothetical protein